MVDDERREEVVLVFGADGRARHVVGEDVVLAGRQAKELAGAELMDLEGLVEQASRGGRPGPLRLQTRDRADLDLTGYVLDLRGDPVVAGVLVYATGEPVVREVGAQGGEAALEGASAGVSPDIAGVDRKGLASVSTGVDASDAVTDAGAPERSQRMVDMARDAYVEVNAEGVITDWNKRAEDMFGWKTEEVMGKSLLQVLVRPEQRRDLSLQLSELAVAGEGGWSGWRREMMFVHRDGQNVVVSGSPWVIGSGASLRVGNFLHDVAEERATRQALAHSYVYDSLTGLPNRTLFTRKLSAALAARKQSKAGKVAVMMLDLDRFKAVNESLGHGAGDEVLVATAKRLGEEVDRGDVVARLGGDEFMILIEGREADLRATQLANAIARAMREPFSVASSEVFISTSIGVAITKGDYDDSQVLLSNADAAVYRAKERGGACYQVFGEDIRVSVFGRMATEASLHRALERDELRVFFQPVVDIREMGIVSPSSVEALIRWEHPEKGMVAPDKFIPVAEETGLIVPIGAWVLEESCKRLKNWQGNDVGLPGGAMSVNLSARQLDQPNLAGMVGDVLAGTGLAPEHLTLEITETALMTNTEAAVTVLNALKKLGVMLAIDDFGTGFSSLAYLRELPLDVLKVDKSFVDGLGMSKDDEAIVGAVINLAHTLDLRVIAEGVETEDQLEVLRDLGCDYAQGFLFSRPVPEADLAQALAFSS